MEGTPDRPAPALQVPALDLECLIGEAAEQLFLSLRRPTEIRLSPSPGSGRLGHRPILFLSLLVAQVRRGDTLGDDHAPGVQNDLAHLFLIDGAHANDHPVVP